ncbi:hypothetical protein ISCU110981_19240 [Isoptericola cucumis]
MDGELAHHRLAGARGGRDQDAAAALERDARVHLEGVELETDDAPEPAQLAGVVGAVLVQAGA